MHEAEIERENAVTQALVPTRVFKIDPYELRGLCDQGSCLGYMGDGSFLQGCFQAQPAAQPEDTGPEDVSTRGMN